MRRNLLHQNASRRSGFTLIEVLVAMVLATVLLIATLSAVSGTSDGYRKISRQIDTRVEARAALGLLARDLDSFTGAWQWKTNTGETWRNDSFSFLCRQPVSAQASAEAEGDLCLVYYYVAVTADSSAEDAPVSPKLYRRILSSQATFDLIVAGAPLTLPTPDPAKDEPVAFAVVSFSARPLIAGANGVTVDWTPAAEKEPTLVEFNLVVTHNEILARLPLASSWQNSDLPLGSPDQVDKNKDLYRFTTRLLLDR